MVVAMRAIATLLVGLSLAASATAAEVRAWVDSTNVRVQRPFVLWIQATGETIEEPELPEVDGLEISNRPYRQSESVRIVNGETAREMLRGYRILPLRQGKFTIPPIGVEVGGKTIFTDEIELNVAQAEPLQADEINQPQTSQNEDLQVALTWEDLVFITSEVDQDEYYLGERVVLTLNLWRIDHPGVSVNSYRGANIRYPSSEGFYATELRDGPRTMRKYKNWMYEVTEYRQYLYPTRTGEVTIGKYHWEGVGQARTTRGLQPREYRLDTPEIEITVKPLPPEPDDFSGAVGAFDVRARLSDSEFLQGVPTELRVEIEGEGNPDALGAPNFPEMDWAYMGEPQISEDTSGETVAKRFVYTLIPLEPGERTIPSVKYVFFNPDKEEYVTHAAGPFSLKVLPSPEQEQSMVVADDLNPEERRVQTVGQDINAIVTRPSMLQRRGDDTMITGAIVLGPAVAYVALAMVMLRRRRFAEDEAYARSYHAHSKGRKRLREVMDASQPADELYRAVTEFLADSFNVPAAGLTSADAERLLEERGGGNGNTLVKVLRSCERARYGTSELSNAEVRALADAASTEMDRLTSVRKGKKPV